MTLREETLRPQSAGAAAPAVTSAETTSRGNVVGGRGFTHEAPGSPDWWTPPSIFSALGMTFDLDPCSPPRPAAPWIRVRDRYSLPQDGLALPWEGSVWLNPPYGDETARWVGRLADHGDGVALTFTRTDTPWWQSAVDRASVVCFIAGRVEFVPGDPAFRRRSRAGAPSCLIAFGDQCAAAVRGANLGVCADLRSETPRATLWGSETQEAS